MRERNRRDFLHDTAALAAAIAALPTTRAFAESDDLPAPKQAEPSSPNETVRVAVVGVRGRGMSHVEGFSQQPNVKVTAICDIDPEAAGAAKQFLEKHDPNSPPKFYQDIRKLLEDKDVDVISIATPNHWHALATIWACQAGKDVYVEKPVSHNVSEGRRMVEAARHYKRIVQTGTQCRSHKAVQDAVAFLRAGKLGDVYMAKGLCYKPRGSIGTKPDGPVPPGVDFDIWLGPAPERPFNPNRFHYNWHWFWDYGNGDLGNQGIHQMDLARWGIDKKEFPKSVQSSGGRFGYKDDGETPNTLATFFEFDDVELQFEVRGLITNPELEVKIGNIFYGTEGILTIDGYTNWRTYFGPNLEPGESGKGGGDHYANFIKAVRAGDHTLLNADIEEGHVSSAYCHLGNIAYRLGRKLHINPSTESFINDPEADAMLTRPYRAPFVVPDKIG